MNNVYDDEEPYDPNWTMEEKNVYWAKSQSKYYKKKKLSVAAVAVSQAE